MLRPKLGLLFVSVVCFAVILTGCGGGSGGDNQSPSFTLSASPSSVTIAQGRQATSTITITPANGFSGSVTFSQPSGLPSGVTAAFNPSTATTSSTLTLTASATAAHGNGYGDDQRDVGYVDQQHDAQPERDRARNQGQINHVVIIFQENRSVDNLFHDPVLMNRSPVRERAPTSPPREKPPRDRRSR